MRQFVVRTMGAVLFLLVFPSPSSLFAQNQEAKKPPRSSRTTAKETTLKADEGPLVRVTTPVPKGRRTPSAGQQQGQGNTTPPEPPAFRVLTHPREDRLTRGREFQGDLRTLPQTPPERLERPEFEEPIPYPIVYPGGTASAQSASPSANAPAPAPAVPAPTPSASFDGLDFLNWGAGHPPDTNGDVGPTYYIQTINTSIGIFRKSDGVRVAAFTFNTFFNGHFGNLCDTDNFGDPVVVYDTFEDRWIITDFAFKLDVSGSVLAPTFQCFAVSQSGDPVGGGWNFYSIETAATSADAFGDYPKFGNWPDGLYMSANMFNIAGGAFRNVRVWAFNKAQMYAGLPAVQILSFDAPSAEFTLLPSNARLQTGTPPAGTPNYFATVFNFLNAVSVYKFHVDWNKISTSTLSGPFVSTTATNWSQFTGANGRVPTPAGGTPVDTLYPRLMVQNQYTNISGAESLWDSHTVGASGATSAQAAPRYYQVDVTGGTVAASATQAFTYSPDTTVHRFMPSVDVDRAGNLAIGYSATNSTLNPAIRYAGRLAGDAANSITQTETSLIEGTGAQTVTNRWGDYSAMTLDPTGCTFWYTNEYYQVNGGNFLTRIGAFSFPSCTPVATGTVAGTVKASGSGNPIQGATVAFGSRATTTDINGNYSFTGIPSGTYPSITASSPGFNSSTNSPVVVSDGTITAENFSLTAAATSGCFVDDLQADFQTGVPTNCDLTSSPGNVILSSPSNIDQQNTTVTNNGFGFNSTSWAGQTFTPAITGKLTRADIEFFCSGCTGTTPDLTVSIRATTGSPAVPTGADLATATITGFSSSAGIFYSANFSSPATLTAGTTYAVIFRATANPSAGTYAYVCSCSPNSNPYPSGQIVTSTNSGSTWTADTTSGGRDLGFKIFMNPGFAPSGTFVSSLKDANPAPGSTSNWGSLSWVATTPANTNIQFQIAASNSAAGPFNFVGPDGTAGTFFTNGASLAQFNSFRYLKYQATLSTSNSSVTPSLDKVSVCFTDVSLVPPPSIAKQFGAATVPLNGATSLAFNIQNPNAGTTLTGLAFTDTLPAGLVVASTPSLSNSCGGTATAIGGSGSVSLSGGTLAASASCTVSVNVQATTAGVKNNSVQITATESGSGNTSNASLSVEGPPSIAKVFNPSAVAVGAATSLTFTITNPAANADALTGVAFTDTLPTGLTVANSTSTVCGGTLTTTAPTGISLTGSTVAVNAQCQFSVTVTGAASGQYTNITGNVSSTNGGTGNTATANLTVANPPTIAKAFGAASIPLNGTASLTFTINNPNTNVTLTGVAFTDNLPAGLVVATPNNLTVTCSGGTATAAFGSGTVSLSGSSLAASASCTVSASIQGTTAGVKNNSVQVTSTNGGTGNTSNASITVVAPPVISKAFGAASIPLNGSTSLQFTIQNNNTTTSLSGVAFSDTLPAGLVSSTPNGLTGSCGGGTITATAGTNAISLSGASIAASSSCTFTVNVTGTSAGQQNNTTGAITSTEGGTGGTASASVKVEAPPSIAKAFNPSTIALNATTSLTFTITNPAANVDPLTGVAFTDTLPTGLTVANSSATVCGGTLTTTAPASISLSGATIAVNSQCQFSVTVTGAASGHYTNTTGNVTSTNAGTGNTATANLTVAAPPTITKIFIAATIPLNGTTTLTFNPVNPNTNVALSGVAFTDNLPAGLVVGPTPGVFNGCGGSVTATPGASSISLSAGTMIPFSSCAVSVTVQGTTAGVKNNTVQITSTEGGTGNTGNASITVVSPPVIIKAFGAASIPLNGSTSLQFTIQNNNAIGLSGVAFSDTLPAGLVVSTPNGLTGACGAGTITATAGTNTISLTGGTIATSSSCTFSVNVTGTAAGLQNNTTGNVSSTEGGIGGTASASINVVAPPSIAKAFNPSTIALNATTSLTFTITNPVANAASLTGVGFTDTLPTGLTVANASATVCSGTLTTTAATGIALSGATIAANAQCQFSVTVTGAASGQYTNTTGAVSSTNGGTGNTATANLTVASPPSITKSFGAAAIPLNGTTSLTFNITNPNTNLALSGVAFTDNFPAGIVVGPTPGASNTCGGTFTTTAGAGSVSLSGGTLAANASCTASLTIQGTTAGVKNNSVQITSTEGGTGNTSNASITMVAPPVIIKAFGAASIPLNGSTSLSFTIQNNNTTSSLSGIAFGDTLPAGLVISTPNGLSGSCGGGTITSTQNTNVISLSSASLAASSSCTFSLNVTGTAAGLQNNTTRNVTSTEGGTGGTASASINVVAPPSIGKVFNPNTIAQNTTTSLTFTITNPVANAVSLTGIGFTDALPTGLTVANASAPVCGGTLTTTAPTGIALSGATIAANAQCQFSLTVTGAASGNYTNTTGNVSSTNGGSGNTASANLTVTGPPTPPSITKAFGAATIPLNGTSSLTFNIQNPNASPALTGLAFTDNLPSGLVVASPPNLSNTCGGTATAVGGAGSVSLSGGTLAANSSCTVSVNIQGTTAGVKNNSVQITSTEGGTGNTSNSSITVVSPPVIIKAFGAATVPLNGSTSLTFTIQNNNSTIGLTGVAFNDILPVRGKATLLVANPNGLTGSCGGGTITATPGAQSISLSGATLAASSSCTFSVTMTGNLAGDTTNTTGNVTSNEGGTGGTASASISVVAPPAIAKAFNASAIALNATTSLTFTITNPSANTQDLTGVAFTDTLPTGLTVANASSTACGGTLTTTAPTGIALSGATISANSQCQFSVTVTGAAFGQYTNTTGSVTSTNGGTGNTASANLSVASSPTITKVFGASQIPLNGASSLTFTINNPNASIALTGVAFTDSLPAGLVVAPAPNLNNACGGAATAVGGSGSVSLSSGTLAANGSCTVSVNIQGTTAGGKNNSVQVTSTEGGTGNTSNASITVVAPPVIIKAFGAATIPLNGSTTLQFTIQNNNTTTTLSGVAFSDTLPAGLIISTPNGLGGSCGAGTITATAGTNMISLSGGTIAASSSCAFTVNVAGTSAGQQNNTTGNVTSTEGGTGGTASASIAVVAPPSIAKAFNPTAIAVNGVSTLTLTITNPGVNTVAEAGVAVTDNLPAGLVVATPNGLANTCGGTATATAGSGSVSLTGGSVAAASSCTVGVNVTAGATGNYNNTTGPVTSTNGGTGNTASASLSVQPADLTITKAHSDPFSRGQTGATYTITVTNSGAGPTTGTVSVVDTLPNVANTLVPMAISGTGWACTLGTLTCTRSDVLNPGASYPAITLTVNVPSNIRPNVTNTAAVSGGGEINTGNDTATDPTHIGLPIQITPANGTATITAGQSVNFGLTLDSSPGLGAVSFSCSGLPAASACTFSPASSSQLTDTINMNIATTARSASSIPMFLNGPTYALLFSTLGLAGIVISGKKGNKLRMRVVMAVSGMALLLALAGCGGRPHSTGGGGTPAGTYTITVTGTSGATSGSTTVMLNVQ